MKQRTANLQALAIMVIHLIAVAVLLSQGLVAAAVVIGIGGLGAAVIAVTNPARYRQVLGTPGE